MNSYLDKISREHFQVEQHQLQYKKIQMRQNLEETLQLKEAIDIERATNVLAKEASLNHRFLSSEFQPVAQKPFNIDGEAVKKVSAKNLKDMFKA